jgi:hypothetical protein
MRGSKPSLTFLARDKKNLKIKNKLFSTEVGHILLWEQDKCVGRIKWTGRPRVWDPWSCPWQTTLYSSRTSGYCPRSDSQLFWFKASITVVNKLIVQTQISTTLASLQHPKLALATLARPRGLVFVWQHPMLYRVSWKLNARRTRWYLSSIFRTIISTNEQFFPESCFSEKLLLKKNQCSFDSAWTQICHVVHDSI